MKNELLEQRNFLTSKELSEIFDHQISVTTINVLIREGKKRSDKLSSLGWKMRSTSIFL